MSGSDFLKNSVEIDLKVTNFQKVDEKKDNHLGPNKNLANFECFNPKLTRSPPKKKFFTC